MATHRLSFTLDELVDRQWKIYGLANEPDPPFTFEDLGKIGVALADGDLVQANILITKIEEAAASLGGV